MAGTRSSPTARPWRSTRTRPRAPSTLPANSSKTRCSTTCSAGPMSATTKPGIAEQISCTNNAESILWLGKRDFPEIGAVTDQALNPAGPKGRFHLLAPVSHSIFAFTQDPEAARAFLRWLTDEKQLGGWFAVADTYYQPFLHGYDNA